MILHTFNQSPQQGEALKSCLRCMKPGSTLLLIENGVYAAMDNSVCSKDLSQALKVFNIYALEPDLKARGMANRIIPGIKLANYDDFVDLVADHHSIQSWA